LSRRLGRPRGGGGTHESDILAWPLRSALPGRGILVPALCPAVCSGPRRPALLDDSAAADRHARQTDRRRELVRGAQGEVAEMKWPLPGPTKGCGQGSRNLERAEALANAP